MSAAICGDIARMVCQWLLKAGVALAEKLRLLGNFEQHQNFGPRGDCMNSFKWYA
jgi:hypothetical protein